MVTDEGDKAALVKRAISQPVISQPVIPLKQPLSQRMSLILGTTSEDEPPPLSVAQLPNLRARHPQNQCLGIRLANSRIPCPLDHTRGWSWPRMVPPSVLIQPPKHRDPIYDVIPEHVKAIRNSKKREEIVLPELDGEKPRLWIPPE